MELQEIEILIGQKIKNAIKWLRAHENSFIDFNGEVISSDMTDDEIYIKITGKNKNDFLLWMEKKDNDFLLWIEKTEKKNLKSYIKNRISFCEDMDKLKKIADILYN